MLGLTSGHHFCTRATSASPSATSRWQLMNRIRQGDLICVRLRLVYQPTGSAAEVVSQSDRVTWRYALSVT